MIYLLKPISKLAKNFTANQNKLSLIFDQSFNLPTDNAKPWTPILNMDILG